jgi:hypothetical protein
MRLSNSIYQFPAVMISKKRFYSASSFLFLILCIFSNSSFAQVGIGTSTPSASAKLEIAATDKGFLPPRIALTSTSSSSPISGTPDAGLLIYNTATANDVTPGYYYWSGSDWKKISITSDLGNPVPVSKGGTGLTTLTSNAVLLGNGTGNLQGIAPGTSGNVLTSNGTTWASTAPTAPSTFSTDITVNGARVGIGPGNIATNVVVGKTAFASNTTGYNNVAVGETSMRYNTTGRSNTAVGESSLYANTTGVGSVAVGYNALTANTTGGGNVGVGYSSGSGITTGTDNVCIGNSSGMSLTTGTNNTMIGPYTAVSDGTIFAATAIGYNATATESNTIRLGSPSLAKVVTVGQLVSGAVTYPNTDGTSGQVLTTNGSGTASWGSAASVGTVDIGGGSYGITSILGSGNFVADATNSKLTYMRVGNIVFFTAIIGKFTMNSGNTQVFEFRPPIASSFAYTYDAMGTVSAYNTNASTYPVVSGSIAANSVYNATTSSYNLRVSFNVGSANASNMFVSLSGSYIVR